MTTVELLKDTIVFLQNWFADDVRLTDEEKHGFKLLLAESIELVERVENYVNETQR
jgi:hypothetical protein